jgi:hypothetical protein
MQNPPNQAPENPWDLSAIPGTDIPLVLNSIVAEVLMGFTRHTVTDKAGTRFEWRGTGQDGQPTTELFDFVREPGLALELMTRWAADNSFGFQVVRIPDVPDRGIQAHWRAYLLRIGPNGEGVPFAEVGGNSAGVVLTLLICAQMPGVDVKRTHKELFPGHYMKLHLVK